MEPLVVHGGVLRFGFTPLDEELHEKIMNFTDIGGSDEEIVEYFAILGGEGLLGECDECFVDMSDGVKLLFLFLPIHCCDGVDARVSSLDEIWHDAKVGRAVDSNLTRQLFVDCGWEDEEHVPEVRVVTFDGFCSVG
jgi:hypothetical protein